jgi:hypothetical protein
MAPTELIGIIDEADLIEPAGSGLPATEARATLV